jgi:hypothetical protein
MRNLGEATKTGETDKNMSPRRFVLFFFFFLNLLNFCFPVATVLLPPSPASSVDTIKALECGSITHPVLIYISAVEIGMFLSAGFFSRSASIGDVRVSIRD